MCVHVCMPATVRVWVHTRLLPAVKRLKGVFFHHIGSAALSPQGAANSSATSLLSLRHNWAAGEEGCSCCSLWSYCIMQLKSHRTYNSCSCCSSSRRKKCIYSAEKSQWCNHIKMLLLQSFLNYLPFPVHQTVTLLCWFYFTQAHLKICIGLPPGHQWHTLEPQI